MVSIKPLKRKGIHEVLDGDIENSYQITDGENVLGYVNFHETEKDSIWVEYILAKHRGRGEGYRMLESLFGLGYNKIEGTAIYGPHFFWVDMGATFDKEPDEDIYDGFSFELTKENFEK